MKKVIFSFLVLSMLAISAHAQQASCCKGKSSASCEAKAPSAASAAMTPENSAAAAKLASTDQTIETRTDPITGNVSYVRKQTAEQGGEVSYVSVNFDPATNSFVNVPPMNMENCSMKGSSGKSCCSMGSSGKSCCSGKSASTKPEKTKS